MDTLLLNADYRPLDLLNWMDALRLLFRGKAHVVAEYANRVVRSPSTTVCVPSVMVLERYQKHKSLVKFSRSNVYSRDRFECQYCGASLARGELSLRDLTLDHVLPRSRGGETSWTNIVTSCGTCNRIKGDRLPKEAGMELRNPPRTPKLYNPVALRLRGRDYPEMWRDFVGPS